MKKIFIGLLFLISIFISGCSVIKKHSHIFSNSLSFDNEYHWNKAICEHSNIVNNKEAHTLRLVREVSPTFEEEGYKIYSCDKCRYQKQEIIPILEHSYSNEYSYDNSCHWNNCIDIGYEDLKINIENHTLDNEVIIKEATDTEVGLASYTCSICNHTYQKDILINTEISELPMILNEDIYVGQLLQSVSFSGGIGSVDGYFSWTDPSEKITGSNYYSISFIPYESSKYATIKKEIYIEAKYLSINIECGENGSASIVGDVDVEYNGELKLDFIPDDGYQVESIIVDGVSVNKSYSYTFSEIVSNHTLFVSFEEKTITDMLFSIEYISGSSNCYSYYDNTLIFHNVSMDSVYSVSGEFEGNIIIDIGDEYKFDLELTGFTLCSYSINPITILSGDKVSITAKKGYENYIYDYREEIDSTDESLYSACIYSLVDLEICGKGSLNIESSNNNGIHTKDDLNVKNLTLFVTCNDNCLKGNDSVEIKNANTTLISKLGDCIKTTNSHINEDTLNQKGSVLISGGSHNLYACCDGIDAAYDILVDDDTTKLNIYTDRYSSYSGEISEVNEDIYYLRYSKNTYSYSIKYYNSDSDYKWVNAEYYTSVSGNRSNYYFYKFNKLSEYSKMAIYMYSSSQSQGQDSSYYAATSYMSLNDNYDTIELSYKQGSLSTNWNDFSSSQSSNMGGMQEGNNDKSEYSTKGLKAYNSIVINAGYITIQSRDDAMHANGGTTLENGSVGLGNITINGGEIIIYSCDDGLHADGNLIINNGDISITNSYEGVEGAFISILSGNLSIVSSDDGINSTSTEGETIIVSGGNLYINANGDGMDSNSKTSYSGIIFNGGNVVIICNSNGNSAIDTDNGYTYNGGRVIALTTLGGMSSESTNCSSFSSIGVSTSISLSASNYLNLTIDSSIKAVVKMPYSMSALAIYLGDKNASFSSSSTNNYSLDSNGVYFE